MQATVTSIDLAPTFLELAGMKPPPEMDGISMVSILHSSSTTLEDAGRSILVEHYGEHRDVVPGCPQYTNQGLAVSYTQMKDLW